MSKNSPVTFDWSQNKLSNYNKWIDSVQDWADRHKISIDSALSIICDDREFNPETLEDTLVTRRFIESWNYANEFGQRAIYERKKMKCLEAGT